MALPRVSYSHTTVAPLRGSESAHSTGAAMTSCVCVCVYVCVTVCVCVCMCGIRVGVQHRDSNGSMTARRIRAHPASKECHYIHV
jgi:hypothetical protein